jgi:predicted MFS family arabinose efflux permease
LLLFVGALTGPVYDAGYSRALIIAGSFFLVFGQMMLSLCTEYWQVLLAQGICVGIGSGLLCVPSTAILSQYFTTRLATAVGITASGSSLGEQTIPARTNKSIFTHCCLGGIIYPVVFHRLQPTIGFPWATRVIGFIMLFTQIISIMVMRVRVLPDKKRAIIDIGAFKELPYLFFVISVFVGFMGLYLPFFYVQSFAIENKITDSNLGFYILAIMNATSAFGRIIPGFLSDKSKSLRNDF